MAGSSFDSDNFAGGLVAKGAPGDNAAPLSITEISTLLKRTVEDRFGHVKLRGELSGVKRAASGHLYCALKDDKAVIDGVMWRGSTQRLSFVPEDGIEVVATGKLTTYAGRSKYQVVIESLEIAGEGALLALLERNRKRFEAEGLFAQERKRPLPYIPQVIGVVTSPTGAVIRDILHRLADRFPSQVLLWPVMVQGQGSAEQVAAAIRGFGAITAGGAVPRPDLLIIARGGGSIEDLWSFNEEVVVRAIAESPIPTISAVGHETDNTLADFAADRRAPTPTAAAEIAVPVLRDLAATLTEFGLRQQRCALRPVQLGQERLDARIARLPRPDMLAQPSEQKLDDLRERLRRGLSDRAARAERDLNQKAGGLRPAVVQRRVAEEKRRLERVGLTPALLQRRLGKWRDDLEKLARVLPQLDPKLPLERGFARVVAPDGQTIGSRSAAVAQSSLTLEFRDGELQVRTDTADTSAPPASGPKPAPAPKTTKKARADAKPSTTPSAAPPKQGDLF
ncbi:exodeoxyribonuclease VII large subunit [Altericroceibacterium endophyticum]|uniref:Exodeoxyribonuclease 7 large subunit n=1 Tax=Altericroceibacterium endophyticum TaxID=1808508 RepID=A0A6I4T3V7_9SPHN|nr:exodeoxyribonuclease VII large subunit [Altericroceibacterium endophyticum]MXO65587.1 exodeoxyribonuclease VII large subunit [Altericroceibacterium endophyticum]